MGENPSPMEGAKITGPVVTAKDASGRYSGLPKADTWLTPDGDPISISIVGLFVFFFFALQVQASFICRLRLDFVFSFLPHKEQLNILLVR